MFHDYILISHSHSSDFLKKKLNLPFEDTQVKQRVKRKAHLTASIFSSVSHNDDDDVLTSIMEQNHETSGWLSRETFTLTEAG